MLEFEWDDDKARSNLAKHGVSFADAARSFRDRWSYEMYSEVVGYELRTLLLGLDGLTLLAVTYTERGDTVRIISARKATKYEQQIYARSRKY